LKNPVFTVAYMYNHEHIIPPQNKNEYEYAGKHSADNKVRIVLKNAVKCTFKYSKLKTCFSSFIAFLELIYIYGTISIANQHNINTRAGTYTPVTLDQVHTTFIKNCEKLGEPTKNLYNAAKS
jgi:hypothetical protein